MQEKLINTETERDTEKRERLTSGCMFEWVEGRGTIQQSEGITVSGQISLPGWPAFPEKFSISVVQSGPVAEARNGSRDDGLGSMGFCSSQIGLLRDRAD